MIEVVDRVPTYPGRVKLTPVSGQANTYDMVRADEPVVDGTPINKALFDSILEELASLRKYVNDTAIAISNRVPLSEVAIGTVIGLYENGVLTPFIVVSDNHNFSTSSIKRMLVVRKDVYMMDTMLNAGDDFYENCKVDLWLNNEYLTYLDAATQAVISPVYVYVSKPGLIDGVDRKVFLLSTDEYDIDSEIGRFEAEFPYDYFDSNDKRKAYFNGNPVSHYTRTISSTTGNNDAEIITADGVVAQVADPVNTQAGIRPAFTLPLTYDVSVLASGV